MPNPDGVHYYPSPDFDAPADPCAKIARLTAGISEAMGMIANCADAPTQPDSLTQMVFARLAASLDHDAPASRFSPTPPKETAMTTTPKAGDEMIATLAEPPDADGFVTVLGSPHFVHISALRPLPDPALTAAQLAVVEAADKWWGGNENHIQAAGAYDALTDALTALRALSTPPDPKAALQAAQTAFIESLDTREMKGASLERLHVFLRAIAAMVGEPKP